MDTTQITLLDSSHAAEQLVATDAPIYLPQLKRLTESAVQVLATHKWGLTFSTLSTLLPEVAAALAPHQHGLKLPSLTSFSAPVGDALAKHAGPLHLSLSKITRLESAALAARIVRDLREYSAEDSEKAIHEVHLESLILASLQNISPEVARALGCRTGVCLHLPKVQSVDADLATALCDAEFTELHLTGLTERLEEFGDDVAGILGTCRGQLFLGRVSTRDIESVFPVFTHPDLLGVLISSITAQSDSDDPDIYAKDPCEFVFHLESLTVRQARAIAAMTSSGRAWVLGVQELPEEIIDIFAKSSGIILLDDKKLDDPAVAHRLAGQIHELAALCEHLPFEQISPDAAGIIVGALNRNERSLALPRLAALTPELAYELSRTRRRLYLDAVAALSKEVALALVTRNPWATSERGLALRGLSSLAIGAAEALREWEGDLYLEGLRHIAFDHASLLADREVGNLHLHVRAISSLSHTQQTALQSHPRIVFIASGSDIERH